VEVIGQLKTSPPQGPAQLPDAHDQDACTYKSPVVSDRDDFHTYGFLRRLSRFRVTGSAVREALLSEQIASATLAKLAALNLRNPNRPCPIASGKRALLYATFPTPTHSLATIGSSSRWG
jgi:hypothetical protein